MALPSERKAVAMNGWSTPPGMDAVAGVTCRDFTVALVTVSSARPLKGTPLAVPEAVRTAVPALMTVAIPPAVTVATRALLLFQLSAVLLVTSRKLPSDRKAVATKG